MRNQNIDILKDTLRVCKKGYYKHNGRKVNLKLTTGEMQNAIVYLPDQVKDIALKKDFPHIHSLGRCGYSCMNSDSFSMAQSRQKIHSMLKGRGNAEILVLNFANPVNPGGGVRRGARAQEEDLCRRSTLLASLESERAQAYYEYNKSLKTNLGSDAIILTPKVEVFKGEDGETLEESFIVAVMTCAAPLIRYGKEGLIDQQYEELFYNRIVGMLKCAAYWGYTSLVLGAFGCGAFGNDAKLVSDLFYKALKEFDFDGMRESDMFRRIDFAVLDFSPSSYNFEEFARNFTHFYRDEDAAITKAAEAKIKERDAYLDEIRGCIFGGAVGDALGYPVEFMSSQDIYADYGPDGITGYEYDKNAGKALISDDTQMTLFTANGYLFYETRGSLRGIAGPPSGYIARAYKDWHMTQMVNFEDKPSDSQQYHSYMSWLCDVPELYSRRAPGMTCLSALEDSKRSHRGGFMNDPINDSKGCGGIMRVAPLATVQWGNIKNLDKEAAEVAAITHSHPLGYMPAAVLCHIINRIIFPVDYPISLLQIVLEAKEIVCEIFEHTKHIDQLAAIIDLAVELADNDESDAVNIRQLGQGWVAEEALAIAIYCSLRYEGNFSAGVIAAVNHDGDSDSTGAITGNILGAMVGYNAIEQKWKDNLELADVILEISDDLCHGCQMSEYSPYRDPVWESKYIYAQWRPAEEA